MRVKGSNSDAASAITSPDAGVTAVIPCRNPEMLSIAIESLLKQSRPVVRVIVAADGIIVPRSFANDAEICQRPWQGKARAVNFVVASLVHTEQVLVMDADTWIDPRALEEMQRLLQGETKMVLPSVFPLKIETWIEKAKNRETRIYESGDAYGNLSCCLLTLTSWFKENPYPEDTLAEDQDLARQLKDASVDVRLCRTAHCFTKVPGDWRSLMKQEVRWCYGDIQIQAKRKRVEGPKFVLRQTFRSLGEIVLALTIRGVNRRYTLVIETGRLTAIGRYILRKRPDW